MFLKKFTPHSLYGRFLLIITVPSIIVQVVAIYVFYYSHIDTISKHMARSVIGEMLFIKDAVRGQGNKELISEFSKNIGLGFDFFPEKKLRKKAKIVDETYDFLGMLDLAPLIDPLNRFKLELKSYGLTPFGIYKNTNEDLLTIQVQLSSGILNFYVPKKRITSSTQNVFTIWMIATSLLMSFISIIFLKNQIRSIKGLSIAAEKFGRGGDVPDFKPSGADEIRSVGISFMKMKERITRQISQRTDMLSGVSHDLRTPLTRMKLQLEMMQNSDAVAELKHDIADMEKMINEYLDFARGGDKEQSRDTKMKEFLEKIVSYYQKIGREIPCKIDFSDEVEISVKRNYLKRAIRNLIDNAFNYATFAQLSAYITDKYLKITIDDNGPGIPKAERENIFKPFYRIDNSRNLDKTGAGLGLAIVLDSVSSHGGKVLVDDSPMGGLRITISLPI